MNTPDCHDMDRIQAHLAYADELCSELAGESLTGSIEDLDRLQEVIDSGVLSAEKQAELQSLGVAFGKVFNNLNSDYSWVMIHDELGRAPALRYLNSNLLLYPQTLLSKRVQNRESVDVRDIYESLQIQLAEVGLNVFGEQKASA